MQRTGRERQEHFLLFCNLASYGFLAYVTSVRTVGNPPSEGNGNIPYMVMPDTHPGCDAKGKTPIGCSVRKYSLVNLGVVHQ